MKTFPIIYGPSQWYMQFKDTCSWWLLCNISVKSYIFFQRKSIKNWNKLYPDCLFGRYLLKGIILKGLPKYFC